MPFFVREPIRRWLQRLDAALTETDQDVADLQGVAPTSGQNAALIGTSGTPGSGNKYVTDGDSRNTNSRAPTGSAGGSVGGTYPSSLTVTKLDETSGPTALTIGAIANAGDHLARGITGSTVIGVNRYRNIYIDPPASPNAFNDEFELATSGALASEDLATRGWTVVNASSGATMTRTGAVDFQTSPAGIGATVYRSTIRNSRLYLQASVSVFIYKAFTGTGQIVGLINQPNVVSGNVVNVRISNNTSPSTSATNRSVYAGQENANVVVAYNNQNVFTVPLSSAYGGAAQGLCVVIDYNDTSKNFSSYLQQPYNGTMTYNSNGGMTATSMVSAYAGVNFSLGSGQVRNWAEVDYIRQYANQAWFPA